MKKLVKVKNIYLGDGSIWIQSMTNTPTIDYNKTLKQIKQLELVGCDIIRLAVCSMEEVQICKDYIKDSRIPLVADIQFDYRLAIECSNIGFSKVRFNPGNIGSEVNVKRLVDVCKANHTPIRIGVNSGSLEKDFMHLAPPDALAQSALKHVALLEKYGFEDIVVSVKSSDVFTMIQANRILSQNCNYPIHLGVTESGEGQEGILKSAIGIGALLSDGIGDTIRVSLSNDPVEEVNAARKILRAVGVDKNYCEIISCPTCSRCCYDLFGTVNAVKNSTKDINKPLKIAIMGCIVNGPGEAKDADCGVAGGKTNAVLFKKGQIIKTVSNSEVLPELLNLIGELINE